MGLPVFPLTVSPLSFLSLQVGLHSSVGLGLRWLAFAFLSPFMLDGSARFLVAYVSACLHSSPFMLDGSTGLPVAPHRIPQSSPCSADKHKCGEAPDSLRAYRERTLQTIPPRAESHA